MRFVAVAAFAVVGLACALIASSCKGFPSKTCHGDQVNALAEDGGGKQSDECSRCIQGTECCDLVGQCGEQETCAKDFKSAQTCIIAQGAASEPACKGLLVSPLSRQLYDCMRPHCGDKCGIPSCDLDKAVRQFGSPACDRCIGGGCCQEVNDCYGNRQCKLVLECITAHCPRTSGTSMAAAATVPKDILERAVKAVCANADAGPGAAFDPGPCLNRCIEEFAPTASAADLEARCRSITVYACGATAGCGLACTGDGGTEDQGPYPEDNPR